MKTPASFFALWTYTSNPLMNMEDHFLLMKSAFWTERYDEAVAAGRQAFNLARGEGIETCAIAISSAYFMKGDSESAWILLEKIQAKTPEAKRMLFLALAGKDPARAIRYYQELYKLDQKAAKELMLEFLR